MCFTGSAPSKKISHCPNIPFSAHAIAQPRRHTTNNAFKGLFGVLQVGKKMQFHCAAGLVWWHCAFA